MSVAYGVSEPDSPRSPRKSVLIGPDGNIAVADDATGGRIDDPPLFLTG